jgi:hypothetical protein
MNVHGSVISGIDIKKLFGLREKEISSGNVMVLKKEDAHFEILMDDMANRDFYG